MAHLLPVIASIGPPWYDYDVLRGETMGVRYRQIGLRHHTDMLPPMGALYKSLQGASANLTGRQAQALVHSHAVAYAWCASRRDDVFDDGSVIFSRSMMAVSHVCNEVLSYCAADSSRLVCLLASARAMCTVCPCLFNYPGDYSDDMPRLPEEVPAKVPDKRSWWCWR